MADNLVVIRLSADADAPVAWIRTDASGARHGAPEHGTLADAAAAAGNDAIIALLPADDVLITQADVPARGARLLQALPFALEEQLAEDIDDLHFAAGQRRASGRTPVAVIRRERLTGYHTRLREAGIEAEAIYAETQGLARLPGTTSLLIDGDLTIINDGADVEMGLRGLTPGDALVAIGALDEDETDEDEERAPLPRHVLVYLDEATNERYSNDWLALRNELDSLETKLLPDGALPRLAATVSASRGINLLQGEFAPQRRTAETLRPWRMAAALCGVVIALSVIGKVTDHFALKREQQRLAVELEEQWKRTLPWAGDMPTNPQSRLNAELRRMGAAPTSGEAHIMMTLTALAEAIRGSSGVKIEAIGFRGGTTDVQLIVPNTQVLERIQTTIQANELLETSIQRADPDDDGGIKSRFQIRTVRS